MLLYQELAYWQYYAILTSIYLTVVNINNYNSVYFDYFSAELAALNATAFDSNATLTEISELNHYILTDLEDIAFTLNILSPYIIDLNTTTNFISSLTQKIDSATTAIQQNTYDILIDIEDIAFTINSFIPYLTDINDTASTTSQFVNAIQKTTESTSEKVTKLEEYQLTTRDNVAKIWEYLEGNSFSARVIKVMNEDVQSLTVDSLVCAQIDFDVCENDPLGIGPINCEGGEIEAIELTGLKFE